MRRWVLPVLIPGCLLALIASFYGPALFRDRQFSYRDAGHYYYPLYQYVEKEWQAGRWPLWEPEENGGMPLLGNPTAAVLYPGKVFYGGGLISSPRGARLYIVAHSLLAFGAMLALLRSWGTSGVGSTLGALSYAFGAPVLFQYCNVIFLVGAAWLPVALRGADRWLRSGRRWGLLELALALAMQTLGGDPESAYLVGLCAGGYALGLARMRRVGRAAGPRPVRVGLVLVLVAVVWVAATLAAARWLPAWRPGLGKVPPRALPWMRGLPAVVGLAWGIVVLIVLARWRRRGWRSPLGTMLAGLATAAVLAGALAAAQLLPVVEYTRLSGRAADQGTHDIYTFSLEPIRLVEFLWPNVFGTYSGVNSFWRPALTPLAGMAKVWVPSLYIGGPALVLALSAVGFRNGPPWRGWLTAIAVVSLAAALGEYASPLWWARFAPAAPAVVGPRDPHDVAPIREDGWLRDGDGSVYWALATTLPGFKQFRFPSKLLTFTVLALSGLAGLGWDRLIAGKSGRRVAGLALAALVGSVVVLGLVVAKQSWLAATVSERLARSASPFGPLDGAAALAATRGALAHALAVLIALFVVAAGARARPSGAWGAVLLVVATADLAVANACHVVTVPQSLLDSQPKVARIIEEAERERPSTGPYRVHRMPIWEPIAWFKGGSADRLTDLVAWERATIQPKYGLSVGVAYTKTIGVAELYDYEWFFGPFNRTVDDEIAKQLGIEPGSRIVVFPRRGFDLWNSRYFVLPAFPNGWKEERRGYASFLAHTERIYPKPDAFDGPNGEARKLAWIEGEDVQVLRNNHAYPRAWVVHQARYLKPITGLDRDDRDAPVREIVYDNDALWSERGRVVYDPAQIAWVDQDKQSELMSYFPGLPPGGPEPVAITRYEPQRVELDVALARPGLVILADVYYPGWRLTIDGRPAPIYRANRMMRGAAVPSGTHHLIYTFVPRSFQVGGAITIGALVVLVASACACARFPETRGLLLDGAGR